MTTNIPQQYFYPPVRRDRPDLLLLIGTRHQPAVVIEIHPVRSAGTVHKKPQLPISGIFPYLVLWLIGKKHISLPIHRSPFGKYPLTRDKRRPDSAFGHHRTRIESRLLRHSRITDDRQDSG